MALKFVQLPSLPVVNYFMFLCYNMFCIKVIVNSRSWVKMLFMYMYCLVQLQKNYGTGVSLYLKMYIS